MKLVKVLRPGTYTDEATDKRRFLKHGATFHVSDPLAYALERNGYVSVIRAGVEVAPVPASDNVEEDEEVLPFSDPPEDDDESETEKKTPKRKGRRKAD